MARFWSALREEVLNTVDDFRTKGTVSTLRDAVLDAGDMAKDAGSWLVGGTEEEASPCIRSDTMPDGDDVVVVELGQGQSVQGTVIAVDSTSEPPQAYVQIEGESEPLLVPVLPRAEDPLYEGLLTGIKEEWECAVQDFKQKGAAGALKDAALDASDMVLGAGGEILNGSAQVLGAAGTAYNGSAQGLLTGIKEEWECTVQDFKQKGAAGALKDAALDASDMVFGAAGTAYNGVRSLATEVVSQVQVEPADGSSEEYSPTSVDRTTAGERSHASVDKATPVEQSPVIVDAATAVEQSPVIDDAATAASGSTGKAVEESPAIVDAATAVEESPVIVDAATAASGSTGKVVEDSPVIAATAVEESPATIDAAAAVEQSPVDVDTARAASGSTGKAQSPAGKAQSPASAQIKFKAAPPPGAKDGGVAEFVATWGLNDSSAELLRSLDDHTRQKVMTEFSPRDGTHNIEGKFNAFVRSLNASAGAGLQDRPSAEDLAEIAPELGEFCATWGLDTAGVAWLHSLPVEVVKVVIAQFEPKEDTQNIIGKLKAFARSVQARQPSMNAALASAPWNNGYGGNMRADTIGPPGADLVTFAEQWSLDEATVQQLRAYPPDVQATVVKNFHPKGEIHNINGKCLAFARSIGMGSQHQQKHYSSTPVDAFANWWQLDDSTRAFMWSLSEDVRRTVIEQFDPAPGTRDIAGRLKQFARSLSMQGHGSYGGGHSSQFVPWNAPIGGKGAKGGPSWSAPSAPASGASAASLSAADQEFLASWGMLNDSRAVGALQQLSPSLKMRALTEFLPGADTRDIGSRFCAFLTSLSRSTQEYGASGPGALGSLALSSFGSTGAPSANHIALGSGVTPSPAVEEFATRWGLEHSCKIRLAELPGEVQELVMTEFNPKGDTIDINGKFVSFMRSVAQRAEVGKRSLGSPVGAPPWQPPNKRPHLDLGGW